FFSFDGALWIGLPPLDSAPLLRSLLAAAFFPRTDFCAVISTASLFGRHRRWPPPMREQLPLTVIVGARDYLNRVLLAHELHEQLHVQYKPPTRQVICSQPFVER